MPGRTRPARVDDAIWITKKLELAGLSCDRQGPCCFNVEAKHEHVVYSAAHHLPCLSGSRGLILVVDGDPDASICGRCRGLFLVRRTKVKRCRLYRLARKAISRPRATESEAARHLSGRVGRTQASIEISDWSGRALWLLPDARRRLSLSSGVIEGIPMPDCNSERSSARLVANQLHLPSGSNSISK